MPAEATVEIVDSPPPAAPPAPKTEIHVTPQAIDMGPMPDDPKPGSARAKMFEALRGKAKDPAEIAANERNAPPAKPAAQPVETKPQAKKEEDPKPDEAKVPEGVKTDGTQPEEKPLTAEEKKKVNPWKLVDQYKGQVGKLEAEMAKLKTSSIAEKERAEFTSRIEKAEQRAKALEEHMGYLDYSKTEDFQKKYQEPYDKAWVKHMKELGQIKVQIGEDQSAPLAPDHLLSLVNLPLEEAKELAEQMNPRFATELMGARKEIRDLFDAQAEALADAKKNGATRIKEAVEARTKSQQEISGFVKTHWDSTNDALLRDEKYGLYFTPVEGDENINQRLAKGYELVDRAFSEDPNNPKHTPEERKSIIKRHSAVRHRAGSWGRVVYELNKERQTVKELQDELKKYRGSTPTTGGAPKPTGDAPQATSARESVFGALRAKAR